MEVIRTPALLGTRLNIRQSKPVTPVLMPRDFRLPREVSIIHAPIYWVQLREYVRRMVGRIDWCIRLTKDPGTPPSVKITTFQSAWVNEPPSACLPSRISTSFGKKRLNRVYPVLVTKSNLVMSVRVDLVINVTTCTHQQTYTSRYPT